ncbi:MAG: conjugal transfer protein TrbI [Azospirillum sp.]|nr:conjugal transfer protein TrbI [Azospirillum sp.]
MPRAEPRPVTRFSRRALIGLATLAGTGIAIATWYALDAGRLLRRPPGPELYNTENKPEAEGLAALPRTYADLPKPPPPPRLGPPLPGDLGHPIGHAAPPAPTLAGPLRADDEEARQRRREADQAASSKVFFPIAAKPTVAALAGPPPGAAPNAEPSSAVPPHDPDAAQNHQDRNHAFLAQPVSRDITSPQTLQTPSSPDQLMAGTVIAASLVTGLSSDLPGPVIGQVTENVYDSVTGRTLLIPQGSRLIGKYDSVVAYGQQRVLLIWTRLIMPDGSSIVLDNLPATDTAGYAGLEDQVDYHTWRLIKGVALATLLGVSSELAANNGTSNGNRIIAAARDSADSSANQVGQRIVQKEVAIQPTLTVRPGWPLRIIVNRDISLRPYRG